jgi:hypothetical protein
VTENDSTSAVVGPFADWYGSLPRSAGFAAKGTIGGALVVLERLKTDFDLDLGHHTAKGGAQIRGVSGPRVKSILRAFGETRPFLSEGGRTNRGLPNDIGAMLAALASTPLVDVDVSARDRLLQGLQGFLVDQVRAFHQRERIPCEFSDQKTARRIVNEILQAARTEQKSGQVAQYLVGAKLHLRLSPEIDVTNDSYSTADAPSNRPGDFLIGDTVLHVTMTPALPLFEKCRANLADGYRVLILVPEDAVVGARQNAEGVGEGRISVEAIESFIGQNLDEMSGFSKAGVKETLRELLQTYNRRVDLVEPDKSVLIEIPPDLLGRNA